MLEALAHWLVMGGYAEYVWPAYGIAAVVLGGLALHSWRWHRASGATLASLQSRRGGGRGRRE